MRIAFRYLLSLLVVASLLVTAQILSAAPASAATAIDQRYNSDAALRKLLGSATGSEYSVAGGTSRNYQWGSLYWSSATGVKEVHGAIRWRYQQLGGPAGMLGFPATDEKRVFAKYDFPEQLVGARNNFQRGAIVWTKYANRTTWMSKPFADYLPFQTYPYFGMPVSDEKAARDGARLVELDEGRMYKTSTGFYHLHGGYPGGSNVILRKYLAKGGDAGFLGLPTSDEYDALPGSSDYEGFARNFQGGRIYQCNFFFTNTCGSSSEAYEVHGAILWRLGVEGGVAKLGFPTSDEQSTTGGRISYFQRGKIFWNSTTQKTTVTYY